MIKLVLNLCFYYKYLKFIVLLILLDTAVVRASSLEHLKTHKLLKVCSESGFFPLEMKTSNGEWIGFDPDMMSAFAETLNVKLEILETKWSAIIPSLITGKCDIIASSLSKTKERERAVAFSEPYFDNQLLIAVRANSANKEKFVLLEDFNMQGVTIAVRAGSTTDLFLQESRMFKNAQIIRFDADADTINSVLHGRTVAFIYDSAYVKLATLNYPGKFYVFPQGVESEKYHIAVRKNDTDLLSEFNTFLANWKKSGHYEKKVKYYFEGEEWKARL